jgi:hypothetical protein
MPFPEWQPIATAPKDGTRVLLWWAKDARSRIRILRWDSDLYNPEGRWTDGEYDYDMPSHWMPLPDPPTQEQA